MPSHTRQERRRRLNERQLNVFGNRPERSSIVDELLSRNRRRPAPILSGAQLGTELLAEGLKVFKANKDAKKEVARFDAAQSTVGEALSLRTDGREGVAAVLDEDGFEIEAAIEGFEGGSVAAQEASIGLLLQNPDTRGEGIRLQQQFISTGAAQQREDDVLEAALMREDIIRAEDRANRLEAAQVESQRRRDEATSKATTATEAAEAQRNFDADQKSLDREANKSEKQLARDIKAGKPTSPDDARLKFIEGDIALGDTIGVIGDLLKGSGLESATGPIDSRILSLSEDTLAFESDLDTVKARLTFEALSDLKKGGATFGALSDNELRAISSSAKNLSLGQSQEKLRENLLELQSKLSGSRDRVTERFITDFGGIDPDEFTRQLPDGSSQTITAEGVVTFGQPETSASDAESDEDSRFNDFLRRKRGQRR